MPDRNRDTQWSFLPNTPTPSKSQPSLFYYNCQLPTLTTIGLEDPLGDKPKMIEEPIMEEEETTLLTQSIVENRNNNVFPVIKTNWEASMKNISPITLPHIHGLFFEDPDTFMFKFVVVYRNYDYASND